MNRICQECRHWCPFDQVYDDPFEPDDVGFCYVNVKPLVGPTSTGAEDTCSKWEQQGTMKGI